VSADRDPAASSRLHTVTLDEVIEAARAAGEAVLEVYAAGCEPRIKGDDSPITEADERAHDVIIERLGGELAVVSEEDATATSPPPEGRFWLVDPLDGTKEFLSRNGEFTINIALIENGAPALGVVVAPALGRLFAAGPGQPAFVEDRAGRREIAARPVPPEGATIVSSRSHGDADALARFTASRRVASSLCAGSSLKFCAVAEGQADIYPRFGRTMEWDTAAGDAIVRAAGGRVTDLEGRPLTYGKPGFENPHFVAWGAGS
jgi:3'(2'), 5'-bisphosphate nucleotidase